MATVDKHGKIIWKNPLISEPTEYIPERLPVYNKIDIEIVTVDGAEVPTYAHSGDAGFDFRNNEDQIILHAGERRVVKTGIKVSIPVDCEIQVRPRSGLALKHGIQVVNSPGTIDSGYRNEIGVILFNSGKDDYVIERNDRIAQGVLVPIYRAVFKVVESLEDSDRGLGGFGSSGKQ